MRPRAHHRAHRRHAHLVGGGGEARDGVDVAAGGGAAEREHRDAGRPAGHLGERAVVPVGVLRLGAREPARHGRLQRLEALQPGLAPVLGRLEGRGELRARVGRLRDGVHHPRPPGEVGAEQGAALVVHVVLEPLLRSADRHHARQVLGRRRRHLRRPTRGNHGHNRVSGTPRTTFRMDGEIS
eukprot:225941-Pyramimonas_sp.AAC.1